MFKPGDRVIWTNGPEAPRGETVGIVLDVTPDQKGSVHFPLYDVQFAFGIRTLHGSELQPLLSTSTVSCRERELLFELYRNAVAYYSQLVSKLVSFSGSNIQADFQFLVQQVDAAREHARETREQFLCHKAEHGCG